MGNVKSVVIKRYAKNHPLPMGNGFSIIALQNFDFSNREIVPINTGLGFMIPEGLDVIIKSTKENLLMISWQFHQEGKLRLFVMAWDGDYSIQEGDELARVFFVESTFSNIRFIEMNEEGRMRVGGPEKIK